MVAQSDILTAARARIVAAYPAAKDRSDLPEGARLTGPVSAFALRMERISTERRAMGGPALEVTERLSVSLWMAAASGAAVLLDDQLAAFAAGVESALLAAPSDLGGLAFDLRPEGSDTATEAGETRVLRADLTFEVVYHATGA